MTLYNIVQHLNEYNDALTIYCKDGIDAIPDSIAVVAQEEDDGSLPKEAVGLEYFLEVNLAKQAIGVWKEKEPSEQQRFDAVLYYAKNDAFLPVLEFSHEGRLK